MELKKKLSQCISIEEADKLEKLMTEYKEKIMVANKDVCQYKEIAQIATEQAKKVLFDYFLGKFNLRK